MGFLSKLIIMLTRKCEFQADAFAKTHNYSEELVSGLVKIHKENKSNLNPDWLYSKLNHTHPTLLQRVSAIREDDSKKDK